jgi:outer membrane protein assembly factor BamE
MLSSMMRAIIAQATDMRLDKIARLPSSGPVRRALRPAALALAAVALASCVYRVNIQQGNYLEAKTIDQLQVGMTRSQTRYLLGTPMVPDAFDHSRWDYIYYLKKGRLKRPQQRHLVVHFEGDKVARIDRAALPSGSKVPMPDESPVEERAPDAPSPSDPSTTQPENPGATQPRATQRQRPGELRPDPGA